MVEETTGSINGAANSASEQEKIASNLEQLISQFKNVHRTLP